ncbi:MAG: hypothetical protein HQM07_06605 [Zetaproteobacteria bacterium]|nr:hypothetical protein [Zetaproteobacteria bacterium]
MQFRTFEAGTLPLAMQKATDALGDDAVIMDRQSTVSSSGETLWKVYAAVDEAPRLYEQKSQQLENIVQTLESLVDGIARRDVAAIRAGLNSAGEQRAFDSLVEIGTSPHLAKDLAVAMAVNGPVASNSLVWADKLVPSERKEVVAMIGPSGVGKTLLAAKLATHFMMKGVDVAMVSLDSDRVASGRVLRAYADILGVPHFTVSDANDVVMVKKQSQAQLLLVDTQGVNVRKKISIAEVQKRVAFFATTRCMLVLPAHMEGANAMAVAKALAGMKPTDLVFTKIDESVRIGNMINIAAATKLPLSYCGFGVDVADHLGWLSPRSLMSLLRKNV